MKTAQLCSSKPSDLLGIEDQEIAFAFNVECADILNQWEQEREVEREKRQMELLTGQIMAGALGGNVGPTEGRSTVEQW